MSNEGSERFEAVVVVAIEGHGLNGKRCQRTGKAGTGKAEGTKYLNLPCKRVPGTFSSHLAPFLLNLAWDIEIAADDGTILKSVGVAIHFATAATRCDDERAG